MADRIQCGDYTTVSGGQEQSSYHTRLRSIPAKYLLYSCRRMRGPRGHVESSQKPTKVNTLVCILDDHISIKGPGSVTGDIDG